MFDLRIKHQSVFAEDKPRDNTTDNVFVQRSHGEDERSGSEGSEDDDYVPYVPVKIRKHQMVSYCALSCFDTLEVSKDTPIRSIT